MISAAVIAYAAAAYWMFWASLQSIPGDTRGIVLLRAAVYLACGPVIISAVFALAYWAAHQEHRAPSCGDDVGERA